MTSILIAVPVFRRPQRAQPLVDSILASSVGDVRIAFLCSPGDQEEHDACVATFTGCKDPIVVFDVSFPNGPGDYARKINFAVATTSAQNNWWRTDFILMAADDLLFHPGWDVRAVETAEQTGAGVVGTNDLGNSRVTRGEHSTHPLVARWYVEQHGTIDEPGKMLHEAYDHNYCNPPEAPIWMADCTFRPLGEVKVGDIVVGWERIEAEAGAVGAPRRALCYSEVLASARREAPLVRVVLESGREFRCTPDHRWLNAAWTSSSAHEANFVTPSVGRSLLHVADEPNPIREDQARLAGWLAGIYDGEGSGIYVATQSTRHNPEIVEAIAEALNALGVRHSMNVRGSGIAEFVLTGGRRGYLDFLLRIAPVRREALSAHILGWRTRESSRRERAPIGARRFGHRDRIVSVEPIAGASEVISLTTTSGNYVAWGYASRNCDDELVETAKARGLWAFSEGSVVEHLHPNWKKAEWDDTYSKGQSRFAEDSMLYRQRERLWA